ncbi:autotransporter domain-containing protein [Thalassospira lucentensis]|uniref:autotransporter outer membrane beta-barrel domain-containing protein n=1 Tax=Thalassospira lucentensis TaxID=168935 RepID=UPI00399D5863
MGDRFYTGAVGGSILAILGAVQFSSDAHAANCSTKGGLVFVGKTAGNANSVWLSGTSAGSFRLDAQGGTVDTWTEGRRGLHLTLSNVVSTGNGGTHHLYDNSGAGCLLDSQNQKGGVNLPPIGDLFPDFVMPERPGTITPPIATLPPTGLMPGLPPGFSPPIGVLPPPEGLMPTLPPTGGVQLPGGSVTPPIGTVPPEGVMPTLPPTGGVQLPGGGVTPPIGTVPPEGVMPTLPPTGGVQLPGGGVTLPIGTVPPEGVMPTLPPTGGVQLPGGGVTPPIGTVPPEGVMPTLPPTGGVQLPGGGVTPPIGTVPPEGITPERPSLGGVQLPGSNIMPPIGTLPPDGLTPTVPTVPPTNPPTTVTPTAPGVTQTVANAQITKGGAAFLPNDNCAVLDVEGQLYRTENGLVYTAPCELVRQGGYRGVTVASISMQSDVVPLTPGREFVEEPLWNFWSETRGIYANDRRHDLDTTAYSGSFLAGFDREIAQGTVAGISGSFETSRSEGFNENLETKAYGMSIGPYIAHRISPEWAVEGSLGYMLLHNDLSVVVLDGSYLSHQLSGATALNGQYRYDEWTFRPRFGLSYAETFVEDYDLSGAIAGNPVTVNVGSDHFGYGEAEMSGEVSTLRVLSDDLIGMPYAELGLHYAFLRPNDGEILSGNLTYEDTSPVSGTLRGGMRFVYDDEIFFDVGAGYLSIGQNGLDVWEATAKVSFAF